MVDTGILSNNMRSPSPECYTTFWMMTIYSDTLHWSGITPILTLLLILTLLPNLTFYLIARGFHRTFATGAACQQRTLTPPDTWSCPTLGLASVLMLRPISPELVLFLDFWVSNIPRYLCFCCLHLHHIRTRLYFLPLNMLHDLYESTLTLHFADAAPPEHRLQSIILDISSNRLFKAVSVNDNTETKNSPFLKIKFANKGIDALNFSNILNQKSVQSNIPPYFQNKESQCISYSYTR